MLPFIPAIPVAVTAAAGVLGIGLSIGVAAFALSLMLRRPDKENPTLEAIRDREKAEAELKQAQEAARIAQEQAEEAKRQSDRDREQARERQEEADRAAVQAQEELVQIKAQMEEAAAAVKCAEERAQEAARSADENAEKLAREAKEERERSGKIREDAEKEMKAARERAETAQKAADKQHREAEAGRIHAEEVARAAKEEARKAVEAKEEAEKQLKAGIQPVVTPSSEEVAAARRRAQYRDDCFHFAVAGISGSGKSSLVNAFRGMRSCDKGGAAVGVTETTLEMTRYPDPNPEKPIIWYDIPGAGTIKCPDWQYFNNQGLYIFDCILVLIDTRFSMTDLAILANARRFNIPTCIIRSKADQHIRNIMVEKGYDSDGDDEEVAERRNKLYKPARRQFIEETRGNVQANLEGANLPDQRVYMVTNATLLSIMQNKMPKKAIDEMDLLNDLFNQAHSRRVVQSDDARSE